MLGRLPRAIAAWAGLGFAASAGWAMLSPRTFLEAIGRSDPYNQDFLQDIGAFQIGFGAVLLAGRDESSWRRTLAVALLARA